MTAPVSSIDPSLPPANTPVASGVVRQQFNRAISDINAIWNYIYNIIPPGGTLVSSFNGRVGDVVLTKADVTTALGADTTKKMGNFQWLSPADITLILIPYAEYAFTVVRLDALAVAVGSTNLTLSVNGVPITGLNAVPVTTIAQAPVATAGNAVPVGGQLSLTLSGTVGANNLIFSMLGQL